MALDYTIRAGKKQVDPFFMYPLPGMDYTQFLIDWVRRRYGLRLRTYPHYSTICNLNDGIFRPHLPDPPDKITFNEILNVVRVDTGLDYVMYGIRRSDSMGRRLMIDKWSDDAFDTKSRLFNPIYDWTNSQVFNYMTRYRLPLLGPTEHQINGIGLEPFGLEWLRAHWPRDYQRILKVFPHAAAHADRAEEIRRETAVKRQDRLAKVRLRRSGQAADQGSAV